MKNIVCVIGTRPEVVKIAPIIWRLQRSKTLKPILIATGQHNELLKQYLTEFSLRPDYELQVMTQDQTPSQVIGLIVNKLDKVIKEIRPEAILVQGDTATAYASALTGFLNRIPVGHIEAGLRTYDLSQPWPEEAFRQMTDRISSWLFAPTRISKQNLISEHLPTEKIYVTGNTVIDTVLAIQKTLPPTQTILKKLNLSKENQFILITGHRRENHGQAFAQIAQAIKKLANQYPQINYIYPLHPNPNVKNPMQKILGGLANLYLIAPLGYFDFLSLMKASICLISDSGGVQEEASVFGKTVVLLRNTTERPEGVSLGTTKIVGSDQLKIFTAVSQIISHHHNRRLSLRKSPYGTGRTSEKIVGILEKSLL